MTSCQSTNDPSSGKAGAPSSEDDDYYHPDACKIVEDDNNYCVELCLLRIWGQECPYYGIPIGTDCQEYSTDTLADCFQSCTAGP